jgi:hypothetical protein
MNICFINNELDPMYYKMCCIVYDHHFYKLVWGLSTDMSILNNSNYNGILVS